jgi:hypothetical protein
LRAPPPEPFNPGDTDTSSRGRLSYPATRTPTTRIKRLPTAAAAHHCATARRRYFVSFRQACVDPGSEALWAGGRRGGPYPWLRPARVVVALRQE